MYCWVPDDFLMGLMQKKWLPLKILLGHVILAGIQATHWEKVNVNHLSNVGHDYLHFITVLLLEKYHTLNYR